MGLFSKVPTAPKDPILAFAAIFEADPRPHKVNLTIGVYRDRNLKTPILASVKQAERLVAEREMQKGYLPIEGDHRFLELAAELLVGTTLFTEIKHRVALLQAPGGTGTLRVAAEMLVSLGWKRCLIPNYTWVNHRGVFQASGGEVATYPYYDITKHALDFEGLINSLRQESVGTVVVLQASCHNPTGCDPSIEQWKEIATICQERKLIPLFDSAYFGFGKGEEDAAAPRHFLKLGLPVVLAASFSKSFSVYGERVGLLLLAGENPDEAAALLSQAKRVARTLYSNPPMHGAALVRTVLDEPALRKLWWQELTEMRERLGSMRRQLVAKLPSQFAHMARALGMLVFTGLSPEQTRELIKKHAIYLTEDGRLSLVGLNEENLARVAEAICEVAK